MSSQDNCGAPAVPESKSVEPIEGVKELMDSLKYFDADFFNDSKVLMMEKRMIVYSFVCPNLMCLFSGARNGNWRERVQPTNVYGEP